MTQQAAIITGGASGIGKALATQLVGKGVHVVLADINAAEAKLVAKELTAAGPGSAEGVELDVRDGAAVLAAYRAVREERGRLDFVFNNAGIGVGGLAEELTLAHWDRTIDVNLRGVVHGVHAAYPIMIEQGFGHIINTASLAGIVMPALMTPYTTTKHAVVGLSMALRAEAASVGVQVSVLCPGFTETPLLNNINPGLPATRASTNIRRQIRRIQPRLYPVDRLATYALRAIARNKAQIVAPLSGRIAAFAMRVAPAAVRAVNAREVRAYRKTK